jgi:hypothetical protein
MNYLSIYNIIVEKALAEDRRKRKTNDPRYVYYERHHIVPGCIGGLNNKENLVLLTAREHFVIHQLLVKIYPDSHKLVFALRMLCRNNNRNHIRNNKEYSWIKQKIAEELSVSQKGKPGRGHKYAKGHTMSQGEKNGMYGKTQSADAKRKQSEKALERLPEFYDFARLPKTESYKQNLRKVKQIRKYVLMSPEGIETIFDRCQDASIYSGVSCSALMKLAGNRYSFDHCKGWKITTISL